ncbi:MAG: phospholipase D-like domain-containing protein [Burkholderiales bacterium]
MIAELLERHWLTLHGVLAVLGLAIYVVGSRTLRQRRRPSAAIAWVIALLLLPYVALPLYMVFGTRKIMDPRQAAGPQAHAARVAGDPETPEVHLRQLAAAMSLPEAASYRQLSIHRDGAQALQALRDLIDGAARTLEICTFVFGKDAIGREIAQRLERRARDGVRVRLLVDGIGAYLSGLPDFAPLRSAGVETALFVPPLRSSLRGRTNLRNHRKMALADGERLWCGGRNLAREYFDDGAAPARRTRPWIDLSFDLRGPLAGQAQQRFEQDWAFATEQPAPEASPPVQAEAPAPRGQLIASGPDQADDTLYTLLVSGFFAARRRILAVTPYFVPNSTLLMSLALAARRGVTVDLVMPAKSNHLLADMARHRALRELAGAGARVWFVPRMIHAKAVVIDDDLALAGSANLDERSLFLNYELMVAFYDAAEIERFAAWIARQRAAAAAYRPRPPGLVRDVAEGLLLWLAFQL